MMFEPLGERGLTSVGTFVDVESSIRAAPVSEAEILHNPDELLFEDLSFLTTKDVNKLDQQDWKKKAANSKNSKSNISEAANLATVKNLSDALARFNLTERLSERALANLFRT